MVQHLGHTVIRTRANARTGPRSGPVSGSHVGQHGRLEHRLQIHHVPEGTDGPPEEKALGNGVQTLCEVEEVLVALRSLAAGREGVEVPARA